MGIKLTAEKVAEGIVERQEQNEKLAYSVLDPSAFKEDGGPSIAERMAMSHGVYFHKADNKRVSSVTHGTGPLGGWDQMRARLNGDDHGRPMIVCFATCRDSVRTIPVLQHDPDRIEDLDTESEDHAADEWRYACMSRPYVPTKQKSEKNFFQDYYKKRVQPDRDGWVCY